jgi:murein DD-endopeptidase MepM/ murein hydrolase activator NlpD
MKTWPLKNTPLRRIPTRNMPGSFWENRGDRFHCGVDLYAPVGTEVVAIEDGIVESIGDATSPNILPYWNKTYYVIIKTKSNLFFKYAELGKVVVKKGEKVKSGQLIGYVGLVLNTNKIDKSSPKYIQNLKKNPSMLHFEMYVNKPIESHKNYLGGNWFGSTKPRNLLDPTHYLTSI